VGQAGWSPCLLVHQTSGGLPKCRNKKINCSKICWMSFRIWMRSSVLRRPLTEIPLTSTELQNGGQNCSCRSESCKIRVRNIAVMEARERPGRETRVSCRLRPSVRIELVARGAPSDGGATSGMRCTTRQPVVQPDRFDQSSGRSLDSSSVFDSKYSEFTANGLGKGRNWMLLINPGDTRKCSPLADGFSFQGQADCKSTGFGTSIRVRQYFPLLAVVKSFTVRTNSMSMLTESGRVSVAAYNLLLGAN
jgi:hypothetical protein